MRSEDPSPNRITREVRFAADTNLQELCGQLDQNLRAIEQAFQVELAARGSIAQVSGEPQAVDRAVRTLREMDRLLAEGFCLDRGRINQTLATIADTGAAAREVLLDSLEIGPGGRRITPQSPGQKAYVDALRRHDLVIGIGPAGTGKTYLAMAMAVSLLAAKAVKRIILARPAVEAGESLGFLPGDMYQKVNPYLRPLYDALYDMLEVDKANRLVERGTIEIAPIAYMRGRTLNDSFIILDEAQNTTAEQMKMFLTRLGYNSRAVVTGDVTQIDLPPQRDSGLVQIQTVLRNVHEIQFVYFTDKDVVRHHLVQRIVLAYDAFNSERRQHRERPKDPS